ncbi:MAG: threonine--tRNA ligase [Gammaproteobacteria bacterium]|nr:threonine--tRNA ligase [Gammaproteobacteria bacterium]
MPCVALPDGTKKNFDTNITVFQVAESIGSGLAKAALAAKINDKLVDTSYLIDQDVNIQIITNKDDAGLEVIRHSAAHVLAQAVKRLFPSAQVTIGPVIADGFYYDFAFERAFTTEDLEAIEQEMAKIVAEDYKVERIVKTRNEAVKFFTDIGELYKAEIIKAIPEDEILSLYKQGEFTDLCRGPHIPRTGLLKAFKLTKVAGAYWRGDSDNAMLQRIYGTAWPDQKQLKDYLDRIEEALKRDHRKLGKQLDLFHLQEEAPGMVFWHPKGWAVYQTLVKYMRETWIKNGYQEVNTPMIVDRSLWEKSGHWEKFLNEMYTTNTEDRVFAVKPMNCPCHIQIFNSDMRSYRDLPLRLAEYGNCSRKEPSGTLHGLMRVRAFVQDDAHIFCTPAQIESEAEKFINLVFKVYDDFGFTDVSLKLATRPEKRIGSDEAWEMAEQAFINILNKTGRKWELVPGDGAFYGPKIEYPFKDCIGRTWTLGTLQLDFSMPERLGAQYIAEDGSKQTPVMLHRAIFGSLERFVGLLVEHHAGKFPYWLAPIQTVIINISKRQADYTDQLNTKLLSLGIRSQIDLRNEKIGFKIREHTLQKVPFLLIVGDQEVANNKISVRTQSGEDLGSMSFDDFIAMQKLEAEKFSRHSR